MPQAVALLARGSAGSRSDAAGGGYGERIVSTVSIQLAAEQGCEEKNLRSFVQFAEVFPLEEIVVSLIRQLSWIRLIELSSFGPANFALSRSPT